MVNHLIQNLHLVEKNDYKYPDQTVTVGGHYLNELLLNNNNNNNNNLKGGGTIYSKLEKYGVPAGLYVSPISNHPALYKIETIIVEQYDVEKMGILHDNLYTGLIKTIHNNTRKKEDRKKKEKTRKR